MVMRGLCSEKRPFAAAVTASLLVHLAGLWLVQSLTMRGSEKSITPAYSSIEVALEPARASSERVVPQRQSRRSETNETSFRHIPESTVVDTRDKQDTPAPGSAVGVEESGDDLAAKASEPAVPRGGLIDTDARDRYLMAVLAHIESHKFYPPPAQRRGLQGRVDVHFTLDARGMISDLDVTGSNSLFVVAARDAINNAMPLPAAPSSDGFPLAVRYQMIFKLQ